MYSLSNKILTFQKINETQNQRKCVFSAWDVIVQIHRNFPEARTTISAANGVDPDQTAHK